MLYSIKKADEQFLNGTSVHYMPDGVTEAGR